jgi:hypothetical protein
VVKLRCCCTRVRGCVNFGGFESSQSDWLLPLVFYVSASASSGTLYVLTGLFCTPWQPVTHCASKSPFEFALTILNRTRLCSERMQSLLYVVTSMRGRKAARLVAGFRARAHQRPQHHEGLRTTLFRILTHRSTNIRPFITYWTDWSTCNALEMISTILSRRCANMKMTEVPHSPRLNIAAGRVDGQYMSVCYVLQ